jgi:hypothetical protein
VLSASNGQTVCFPDLPTSTRVPLILYDDRTPAEKLGVVMEYQFGDAESWHHEPYFENMQNVGGGRYDFTFGPYFLNVDFRIRFTVRVTDGDGAVSQLAERIIVVRNCPPPPPPNQPPTVQWIDSGHELVLTSIVEGSRCWPDLPETTTLTARVADDTTPVDQLQVYLVWMYGEIWGEQIRWLPETYGAAPMTHVGNGQYNFPIGPYHTTTNYIVWYYVTVADAEGATASTEDLMTAMGIRGCVILY